MYAALARSVILEEESDRAEEEVRAIRSKRRGLSRLEVADAVIGRGALRSAAVGALASAPAGWLGVLPAAVDLSYQVVSLNRLLRTVAFALDRPTTALERTLAAVASLSAAGAAASVRAGSVAFVRRRLSRRSPYLSAAAAALVGGVLSGAVALALGRAARVYCRSTAPPRPRR